MFFILFYRKYCRNTLSTVFTIQNTVSLHKRAKKCTSFNLNLCKICILLSSSNSPSLKTLEMYLAITERSFCVCYCIQKSSSSEAQNFRLSENETLALPFRTEENKELILFRKDLIVFQKRRDVLTQTPKRF